MMLSSADQSLFTFAIPAISKEFRIGIEVIGQMLSLSFLVASFVVVASGVFSDRIGRRGMLLALLAASAVAVGAHGFANTLTELTALRVAGFALGAGIYPIANTLVVEAAPARFRGLLAGWLQIGYPLGFTLASWVAAPLIVSYGWRTIFLPAFAVLLLIPLLMRWLPESERFAAVCAAQQATPAAQTPSVVRALLQPGYRRRVLICFAGSFLISLAIGGTTYFLPTYLIDGRGLAEDQASLIVGGSYLIGVVGYLLVSYLGEFVLTRRNALLLWLSAGIIAFLATLWIADAPTTILIGLGLSILFFYGSEAIRMPLIGELFPTECRVTATAMTGSLAVTLAWLTAPLLITYSVGDLGWAWTFTLFAALPLAMGTMVFALLDNQASGVPIEQTSAA
jgi:MFS family permease